ncbi:MAG TPA: cytochrome c oxidase subunit 3 [Albitalea sp.]|nr:cytochrome c oxidase subunit 3 [Albitalea sp.]
MNPAAAWRATAQRRGSALPGRRASAARRGEPAQVFGVALWTFIGVATALFSLFITAYVMRMSGADAVAIAMPRQLWLSTACLVLGSLALQRAAVAPPARALAPLWMGGACAMAFLLVQSWAWQALLAQQVTPAGNPAGGFFYLLTTMHGLHVAGGLVAWAVVARSAGRQPLATDWRIALCARYWHFLLIVWLALFACFIWITPDVARVICRTP